MLNLMILLTTLVNRRNILQVNSILRHVAELLGYESNEQLEELYEKTAWHFDKKYGKPGASFEAFKHAVM